MFRFALLYSAISVIFLSISVSATAQTTTPLPPPITTTQGSQFLTLNTGPGMVGLFNGLLSDSGIDRTQNGNTEEDIAVLSFDFDALAGQAVSFDYNFLTGEFPGDAFFSDGFEVSLNGTQVVAGSVGTGSDVFPQLFGFDLVPIAGSDGSFFGTGQLGFQNASGTTVSGTNTLEFFIGDDGDAIVDSALLVDNILLDGVLLEGFESQTTGPLTDFGVATGTGGAVLIQDNGDFTAVAVVPEPATFVMMLGLGIATLGRRQRVIHSASNSSCPSDADMT